MLSCTAERTKKQAYISLVDDHDEEGGTSVSSAPTSRPAPGKPPVMTAAAASSGPPPLRSSAPKPPAPVAVTQAPVSVVFCDACAGGDHPAVVHCVQCTENLCEIMAKAHRAGKKTNGHQLVSARAHA